MLLMHDLLLKPPNLCGLNTLIAVVKVRLTVHEIIYAVFLMTSYQVNSHICLD